MTPSSALSPKHMRGWQRWALQWALLCFLGFYSLGALPHKHTSVLGELDCPVCHVAGHQSLDTPSTAGSMPTVVMVFLLLLALPGLAVVVVTRPISRPPGRGPPSLSHA
ncbi:MAG: hypothetical protein ACOY4L_01120 [Pseudomonadota bacterium]